MIFYKYMYNQSEKIIISYLETLNKLLKLDYKDDYDLKIIINNSIKEIEKYGGKVRLIENNTLALIEFVNHRSFL